MPAGYAGKLFAHQKLRNDLWDQAKERVVAQVVRFGGITGDNKAFVRRALSKEEGIFGPVFSCVLCQVQVKQ